MLSLHLKTGPVLFKRTPQYTDRLISKFICLVFTLVLITGCEFNKIKDAEQLYNSKRYAAAIEQLDYYVRAGENGAYITRAELIRSSCYYELGAAAVDRENWNLAIRLLKLSNSEQADVLLAKVYRTLAYASIEEKDYDKAMTYLNLVTKEISTSEVVPEIIQTKIQLYMDNFNDKISAWNAYMFLFDHYPDNEFEIQARPLINRFISDNIDAAVSRAETGEFDSALESLFEIRRYPVGDPNRVDYEISNIYQELAEISLQNKDYFEANRLFLKAIQYFPAKQDLINKRLRDIAYLYIEKGNDYMEVRDFENALLYYQKSFEIIPDFELAKQAISNLNEVMENIRSAEEIASEAEKMEAARNYPEAKRLFTQAYQLDKLSVYQERAVVMSNLLEAEKDPVAFALTIITDYGNGVLYRRIQAQKQQLLKKFKLDEIKDTGWKILRSTGQFKYEARYDLLTPGENLYFIWQVNLREKTITPLNKISEKLIQ
jgi:tetratricopeptide (TPR) repeat protein